MYKCPECGAVFETPNYETVDMEDLYGVGREFDRADHHYKTFASCPECHELIDTEWDIYYEDENDE